MNHAIIKPQADQPKPILPSWIFDAPTAETLLDAGFNTGSALALLHGVLADHNINVPADLLRNRLALRSAQSCCKIEGRSVTEADLRDAFLLTAPGDARGLDGDMLAFWRAGCSINLNHSGWSGRLRDLLPEEMQEHLAEWIDGSNDTVRNPVSRALSVLTLILKVFPRREAAALLCADCVLSRSLRWLHPLPLFGLHLKRKSLRDISDGEDIRIVCHEAVAGAAQEAIRLAHDLSRRATHLRAVEPKLRTKGSQDAVCLFLSEDAVLPSTMLSPTIRGSSTTMTPRSARRLCERLIELGVVRELTGRATFRLYGVA